ncbi:MAG: DNA polymerase III subunit delta [Bacteroidales bacterium]|nr:DNA polymerase III subunit delta [Anaerotignum sp.]MCI5679758.1 DNA polymerase III subunit delta [Bacteroidales bacterium]MDY3927302.1 DNA polymerase III subunit delta [Anaerotignum sp.]
MKTLKKNWKNHEFSRCYLFYGAETYLIREYEAALTKAILPEGAEMMNHDIFEEKRATAAAIMDAAETLPFLNEKRLVTVRNSEFFQKAGRKEEGEKLKAFLADLPETVCLLFIEEKAEKTNGLYKAVAKYGQAVEFKKPTEKDLGTWIKKRCKENGMEMSEGVLNLFLQTVDHDMENIDGELQKLMAYKGEEKEIKAEDIRAVCIVSLEARVFDLVRAVAEKRPEKAVQIYRTLLSMKESPYMVLSLITRQFRLILETMLLSQSGMTNDAIGARLEIRDFAVKEYLRQSKRFSAECWKQAVRDCLQVDLDIKSGKAAEETAVELLIMKYSGQSAVR